MLTADIGLGEIKGTRLDFDAAGHYARPGVFRLMVDETSRTLVAFRNAAGSDRLAAMAPWSSDQLPV